MLRGSIVVNCDIQRVVDQTQVRLSHLGKTLGKIARVSLNNRTTKFMIRPVHLLRFGLHRKTGFSSFALSPLKLTICLAKV